MWGVGAQRGGVLVVATDAALVEGVRSEAPWGFPKQSRSFPPQAARLN